MFVTRTEPKLAHLEWRVRLFGAGAILAMVGIFADQAWLVDVAIAVLLIGFGLRFFGRRGQPADPDAEPGEPPPQ